MRPGGTATLCPPSGFTHSQPRMSRLLRALVLSCLVGGLAGCIYVPVTTEVYDRDCQVVSRQMALQPVQVGGLQHCSNEGCAVLLVAAGATAVASAVVSGSIVVVGNVVYWFEKRGRCSKAVAPPPAPPAAAS